MSELVQMVYISFSSSDELSETGLNDLLKEIRKKNKAKGVTGLLLYNNGTFIQVIEGERSIIEDLFKKLEQDARHNTIVVLLKEKIEKRSFPNWSMGYVKISSKQAAKIPGLIDFVDTESRRKILENSTSEVMYLLNSFREHT